MNQTRQKQEFSETGSRPECTAKRHFKSPSSNSNHDSPSSDSNSKRAHQDYMTERKSDINRLLREEEE